MLRRRIPWWTGSSVFWVLTPVTDNARRGLKTLDVREYRPLATPMEFRFYQRYTNHPNRQSGIQFLTHYDTHQRFRVKKDFIDYMHWGKEQGQARLPHRHQRVAFDFDDELHPTRADSAATNEWFAAQDPTMGPHPDLSSDFDPNRKVFSYPEHWNKMFSKRRPGEGDIKLSALPSSSLLRPLLSYSDTRGVDYFGVEERGHSAGLVPGVNAPFLGEMDRKMMQAMSRPLNKDRTLTGNDGRFSKTIMINEPKTNQALSGKTSKELAIEIDRATNAVYSKLTVLEAAQSGQTDYFCGGMSYEQLAFDLQMAAMMRDKARAILEKAASSHSIIKETPVVATTTTNTDSVPSSSSLSSSLSLPNALLTKAQEQEVEILLRDASRYDDRVDDTLRQHASLIWRSYTAARPLMTLTNGKCRGTGCGLALYAKYCALKDSSEFIFDGPNIGITPYGGVTRLLARPETSLKYPGLAEFIMLTGTSLFAGDALRLGWTDLFTTLQDTSHHIKEWFNNTEHMHNDAVAWQLGQLLETCFKMTDGHVSAMERAALTPVRARWIEDAFADQPSVRQILSTLSEIEQLPLSDTAHNTYDLAQATPFTLDSVATGLQRLERHRLRYTLAPWDVTPPVDEVALQHASSIFCAYVLERHGSVDIVVHRDRERLAAWQRQREAEYHAHCEMRAAPLLRHVYCRLEGCENRLVSFDFTFFAEDDKAKTAPKGAISSLDALRHRVLEELGMPVDRSVDLGWYMPTLDTCPIHNDAELMDVLHADPGIEDPQAAHTYPPVYFVLKRNTLHFSEWAYAVKHQLLLQSPFALLAAFELLQEVRGDGAAEHVPPLAETLAVEFRYASRLLRRADFFAVGAHTDLSAAQWDAAREARRCDLHRTHVPTRPAPPDFDSVFERNVTLDGHHFLLRPRWSPRTVDDVAEAAVLALRAPLSFGADGVVGLHAPTQCGREDRLDGMLEDAGGLEVVAGLGERDKDGAPRVAPLLGNARVPTNVSFYEMARHPWEDAATSWRRDGLTDGSRAYRDAQYRDALRAVHDEEGRGAHSYWPSRDAAEGTATNATGTNASVSAEAEGAALLDERLLRPLEAAAARDVEPWARSLRRAAGEGALRYKTEIATQEEKIYDDEYYRWFIQPGHHPNPSGLTIGRKGKAREGAEDPELERILRGLTAGAVEESFVDAAEDVPEADEGEGMDQ